ncbi:MAG: histidine kinase [Gemmatimonadota bacterium]
MNTRTGWTAGPGPSNDRWRRAGATAAIIAGGWTTFGVVSFGQAWLFYALPGAGREPPIHLFLLAMGSAWIWALLTPLALWWSARVVGSPARWARILGLHILAGLAFILVSTGLERTMATLLLGVPAPSFARSLLYRFDSRFLAYLVIVTLAQVNHYLTLSRDRQLESAQLATQLARAELQVLKMQLQPHFLFNALNAISELVHQDPGTADRLIARLGHLLRLSLDQAAGHQMVPLRQELEFLRAYLEIEQTRFGARLAVELVAGLEVLDAAVPTLLLQPLVENAIRHGAAQRADGGRVSLHARRDEDRLRIVVEDNGPGFPEAQSSLPAGLGLRNTRERLRQLYGADHRFRLANAPEGGARLLLELPFREISQANTPLHLRAVTPTPLRR